MESEKWPVSHVPSLHIDSVEVRPYILGECAFSLSKRVMKTCSREEIVASLYLSEWKKRATATRKPLECAFDIPKNRFSTLLSEIWMEN